MREGILAIRSPARTGYDAQPLPPQAAAVVAKAVERYGSLTGSALIELTHQESPWLRANARRTPGGSVCMETEWIRDWFRQLDEPTSAAVLELVEGAESRQRQPARPDDLDHLRARLTGG